MLKITESSGPHRHLEKKPIQDLLKIINDEDKTVAFAVEKCIPQIKPLIEMVVEKMKQGGRLFYIGAGTSGRLGILDASECPPTFGVPHDWVIGLIAGGDQAIRKAVEHAEDSDSAAWKDLMIYDITEYDAVIGIAASGTTTYVVEGLKKCQQMNIATASISCNPNSLVSQFVDYPVECIVGPEVVAGSTRMKSGTAQKLILNMISTSVMIQLGRVEDNKMVDMQLSNDKLIIRGANLIAARLRIPFEEAKAKLLKAGSVRKAFVESE